MRYLHTSHPTFEQWQDLQDILSTARQADDSTLSLPDAGADTFYLLAYDNDIPVGFAAVEPGEFGMEATVIVHPQHRRHGCFTALVKELETLVTGEDLYFLTDEASDGAQYLLEQERFAPALTDFLLTCTVPLLPGEKLHTCTVPLLPAGDTGRFCQYIREIFFPQASEEAVGELLSLCLEDPKCQPYFLMQQAEIVGITLLTVDDRQACTSFFGIDERFRGQGLGRAALQAMMKLCREKGIDQMTVQVSSDNEPAMALYTSMGFIEVDRLTYCYKKDR